MAKPIVQPDLSACPVWNSATRDGRHGGVLIDGNLVLFIKHFPLSAGTVLIWDNPVRHMQCSARIDRTVLVGPVIVGVLAVGVLTPPLPIAQPYDGWSGRCWTRLWNGTLRVQERAYRQGSRIHWIVPLGNQNSGQPVTRRTAKGIVQLVSLADGPNDGPVLPSLAKIRAAVAKEMSK